MAPAPAASSTPAAQPGAASTADGEVVLTALEDGVWLRLYEEGGERLIERTLKLGETVLVPGEAADPRINTGRPDALSITVGGKAVAKLSNRPTTLSGAPVSAAALLARAAPRTDEVAIAQTGAGASGGPIAPRQSAVRRPVRQLSAPAATSGAAAQPAADAPPETAPDAAPEPEPTGN